MCLPGQTLQGEWGKKRMGGGYQKKEGGVRKTATLRQFNRGGAKSTIGSQKYWGGGRGRGGGGEKGLCPQKEEIKGGGLDKEL